MLEGRAAGASREIETQTGFHSRGGSPSGSAATQLTLEAQRALPRAVKPRRGLPEGRKRMVKSAARDRRIPRSPLRPKCSDAYRLDGSRPAIPPRGLMRMRRAGSAKC